MTQFLQFFSLQCKINHAKNHAKVHGKQFLFNETLQNKYIIIYTYIQSILLYFTFTYRFTSSDTGKAGDNRERESHKTCIIKCNVQIKTNSNLYKSIIVNIHI